MAVLLNRNSDDFLKGYSKLGTPDERMEGKVEGELMFEGFEELMRQYEEILSTDEDWESAKKAVGGIGSLLEPEQINNFLQATRRYENHKRYSAYTGSFITQLIQNSHDAGNNHFGLYTKTLFNCVHNVGFKLEGKKNMLLEIIIDGNVGNNCAASAKNLRKLHIAGNAGHFCGSAASNIDEINIGANVKLDVGSGAKDIRTIYIGGMAGPGCGVAAENSTFKTPNEETLQLLKKNLSRAFNNKIYFIHEDGLEEEIIC
ncbi:MAG: hypothetical protein ABIB71_05015 [Candidatus Woesearchaeota archaeon]